MSSRNQSTLTRSRTLLAWMTAAGVAMAALAPALAGAAVITVSSTPPVVDGADIAVLTVPTDIGNHKDKWWSDTTNHGQTFMTGSTDVFLNSFTFQTSTVAPATKTYSFRVGSVSGSSFSTIAIESAQQTVDMAANDYITFHFSNPILLSANTLYGIDGEMTGSTTAWQSGIPYIWYHRTNLYPGGDRYTRADGDPGTISVSSGWDRVFHLDLDPVPQPESFLKCQLGLLDLTANGGINPATGEPWKYGDTYRFAFHTNSDTGRVTGNESTDIAWYNAFVQNLADASTAYGISAADGATWKVIGSTAAVNARDNTETNPNVDGFGEAIFLLDGTTLIASNYSDLWDGSLQSIINLTERGEIWSHWPYTGTKTDGTARDGGHHNGPLGPGTTGQGNAGNPSEWVWRTWTGRNGDLLPLYALSMPLSVVPEPSSALLALLGLVGLLMMRRKR